MNNFHCRMCGERIDQWDKSNKLFCENKCRQKAYRVRKGIETPQKSSESIVSVTGDRDEIKNYVEVDNYETKTKKEILF